jgi:hypothetical protein
MDWFDDWQLQLRKRLLCHDLTEIRADIKQAARAVDRGAEWNWPRLNRLLTLRHEWATELRALSE